MDIGIYTRTFIRPTLAEALDCVAQHGIRQVQFNLATAGVPTMPDRLDRELVSLIRRELAARDITMASIAGTFNIIDPDLAKRQSGMRQLGLIAAACHDLGTSVITFSTGTRHPDNMWARHPDNDTPEAWADMLAAMTEATAIAEAHDVTIAFEPEVSNVVDSAVKARRLLDHVGSSHLKIVIDGANLFHTGELPRMQEILDEAFALLGDSIVLAHAKDLSEDGEAGHEAAGHGLLDYDRYVQLLHQVGYDGPLVLHGLKEDEVDGCVAFLRGKIDAVNGT